MNIVFLSPTIYPCVIGGLEVFNYYLIKTLSDYHNILIFTNCKYKINDNVKSENLSRRIFSDRVPTLINIFFRLIKYNNHDVFIVPYTSNSNLIYPFQFFHFLFKVQYIIVIHGGGMYPWKRVFFQKMFFNNASDIVAVSEPIKLEYEKRTGRSIKLIPPLIPFEIAKESKEKLRKNYNFSDNDLIIIFVGSLKKIKGCESLLEAFIKLGHDYIKNNHLKLVFIGDGPLKTQLNESVRKNNYQDYVRFMGNIPHEKVNEIYKIPDVYVISSLFEGTPLSLLEAMFNSLPIIGSNVKGINNLIKHGNNGLLFKAEDYNDLKNNIKYFVQNREECIKLGIRANETYMKNFSYENMINLYNEIISEIKE